MYDANEAAGSRVPYAEFHNSAVSGAAHLKDEYIIYAELIQQQQQQQVGRWRGGGGEGGQAGRQAGSGSSRWVEGVRRGRIWNHRGGGGEGPTLTRCWGGQGPRSHAEGDRKKHSHGVCVGGVRWMDGGCGRHAAVRDTFPTFEKRPFRTFKQCYFPGYCLPFKILASPQQELHLVAHG